MSTAAQIPPDVQKAIDRFQVDADKIIQPFVESMKTKQPPPVIYHYTDDGGLRGILESGLLRLTNAFSLNDPSELNPGFSLMLKVLISKSVSPEAKKFSEGLVAFSKRVGIRKSGNYFVCSFSAAGDDLGQWRAYADNGRGFVLGFDTKELKSAFTKAGDPWFAQASPHV